MLLWMMNFLRPTNQWWSMYFYGKKKMWYFLSFYSFNRKHIITQYFWQEPGPSYFVKKKKKSIMVFFNLSFIVCAPVLIWRFVVFKFLLTLLIKRFSYYPYILLEINHEINFKMVMCISLYILTKVTQISQLWTQDPLSVSTREVYRLPCLGEALCHALKIKKKKKKEEKQNKQKNRPALEELKT